MSSRTLSHPDASGLLPNTYTEWNLSGKHMKITHRLHFGYCLEGFRVFVGKKCENQASGFRRPASEEPIAHATLAF
jgi:hypothetical protein